MNYKKPCLKNRNGDLSKRWFVEYYTQEGRKVVYLSSKIQSEEERNKAAKLIIEQLEVKLMAGFNPLVNINKHPTIIAALALIIEIKNKTCTKRGKHTYGYVFRKFINWLIEKKYDTLPTTQINVIVARQYFDYLIIQENIRARTYNNHINGLRTLFNALIEREYTPFNPFQHIKKLPQHDAEIKTYTPEEKAKIKAHLPHTNKELYLAAMFVYYCFIRPAELVRLQFKDIFIERGFVLISSYKSKNKKTQPVIIPDPLAKIWLQMGYDTKPKEDYIFSNNFKLTPGTRPIAPTRIAQVWQNTVQKELGIKKGIYLFKHTGAGELFEAGADARNIQLQMRHHSLDETQIYLNKFSVTPSNKLAGFFKEF
ncbi:MAG: tyrosine-type recombinase/integrase [Bacteroidetes bacterium]|nr:tyrosine-type recombinase/integrase [Bacteroidota bacterium]